MSKPVSPLPMTSVVPLPRLRSIGGCLLIEGERIVAEETAIALVLNGVRRVMMMATPTDLVDFATGLCLSEEIITRPEQITELVAASTEWGVELRLEIFARRRDTSSAWQRRRSACSDADLETGTPQSVPSSLIRKRFQISCSTIETALAAVAAARTDACVLAGLHAAAFWRRDCGLVAVREDVSSVYAVDKLAGALARMRVRGHEGILLSTGRASAEIVQKAARIGAQFLVAVGGPTGLAARLAQQCGITLVAHAHDGDFEVFSNAERVAGFASATVARNYAFIEAALDAAGTTST